MIVPAQPGTANPVPMYDKLVARWEVGQLAVLPVTISLFSLWAGLIGLTIASRITGAKPVLAGSILCAVWIAVAALEIGRAVWTMQHRYASPRWMRGVNAAVGNEVIVQALAALIERHDHEPEYVVTRSDLIHAVRDERARLQDMARRGEGIRLIEEPTSVAVAHR